MSQEVAVVFMILDPTKKFVLMEERGPKQSNAGQNLYLGEHLEDIDGDRFSLEARKNALLRGFGEELPGVTPWSFIQIDSHRPIKSKRGTSLEPYLVDWEGVIPSVVGDRGNPVLWESIANARLSENQTVRQLTLTLESFLRKGIRVY
jgi:hypothetical protein